MLGCFRQGLRCIPRPASGDIKFPDSASPANSRLDWL